MAKEAWPDVSRQAAGHGAKRAIALLLLTAVILTIPWLVGRSPNREREAGSAGFRSSDRTDRPDRDASDPPTPSEGLKGKQNWFRVACGLDVEKARRVARGTMVKRSPDITFLPKRPHFIGSYSYTSHSGPDDYLQQVPLVLYGPGFVRRTGPIDADREITVADIAPTIAELVETPWPKSRDGRVLDEALLPRSERRGRPALVVVVVWDGGGMNVLDQWPAAWPHLAELMDKGASYENAVVGSSPSVTPAIHATIGAGTFPDQHGVVDMWLRTKAHEILEPDPAALQRPTVADLYDRREDNEPVIGVVAENDDHFAMMGQGANLEGADQDLAVMVTGAGSVRTISPFFALPQSAVGVPGLDDAIYEVDSADGSLDSRWLDTPLDYLSKGTPAWVIYQTKITEQVLTQEGFGEDDVPDIFFTNYKEIDLAGHAYNMVNPEVRSTLEFTDAELPRLMALLNRVAGRGRWVMMLTADHGQQPEAKAINAWPIEIGEVADDLSAHFDLGRFNLISQSRPTGFWLNRRGLRRSGGDIGEVAEFFLDYTIKDNAGGDLGEFESRANEPLFEAAIPGQRAADVLRCAESQD